jgi:hypothetical protein
MSIVVNLQESIPEEEGLLDVLFGKLRIAS